MLGPNGRKILDLNAPGTATSIGGDDVDILTYWHENTDLTAGEFAGTPHPSTVATPTSYRDNRLRLLNQAQTKSIRFRTLAFTNDCDLTVPLLTDNDELLLVDHPSLFYNKTISVDDNTLTTTGISSGDLLKSNGVKFVKMVRGLPGQVLTVKSDGLDLEWANPSAITTPTPSPSPPAPPPPPGGPFIPDDNTVTSAKIVDGSIATIDIGDLAVTTAKIADLNITTGKIANLGVTGAKIADLTITSGKLADASVSTTKIIDANVTNVKLAGSITGSKLVDGTITGTQIGSATVTNANLAGSIDQSKLNPITDTTKLPSSLQYDWTTAKYGVYCLTTNTGADGIWNGLITPTTGGTFTPIITNDSGVRARWTTGAVSGNQAGIRTQPAFTRANNNPRLKFRISYDTTLLRVYVGFIGLTGAFASGADPLNTRSGIGFFIDTGVFTNVRLAQNDAVGGTAHTDLSPTTTIASGGTHTIDLYTNDRGVTWHCVFNGTDNVKTTDIPVATTDLAMFAYVETLTTAAKILDIRSLTFSGDYGP